MDPVLMFERAATDAAAMVERVRPDQWSAPTPCTDWDVEALVRHMQDGSGYLLAALGQEPVPSGPHGAGYREAMAAALDGLRAPGALDRRCMSPAGFEWSVADAAAGTAMDQLVHTWDLAVAIDGPRDLDDEVVDAVTAMFIPQMPDVGRAAGFIGPEVAVAVDAPTSDRLLGAVGRHP
jgi:uncharacterized protein (TIGR03086 family)